jgi:hypothetical protein
MGTLADDLKQSLVENRRRRQRAERCCPDDSCPQHEQWDAWEDSPQDKEIVRRMRERDELDSDPDGDVSVYHVPDGWDQVDG